MSSPLGKRERSNIKDNVIYDNGQHPRMKISLKIAKPNLSLANHQLKIKGSIPLNPQVSPASITKGGSEKRDAKSPL
jgi:hypothetical protein